MSRKSQAYAEGGNKYHWDIQQIEANEGRFKATCRSHPQVFAFGDSEQEAMQAGRSKMEVAVERAEI